MTSLQNGWVIAEYLEKFSGLDASVANKLIGAGQGWAVAKNLEKFSGLDVKIAVKLYRDGTNLVTLKKHPQSFNFDINEFEKMIQLPPRR